MEIASFRHFGIVELCSRCGGGLSSEDEIDMKYSCVSKHGDRRDFLECC